MHSEVAEKHKILVKTDLTYTLPYFQSLPQSYRSSPLSDNV